MGREYPRVVAAVAYRGDLRRGGAVRHAMAVCAAPPPVVLVAAHPIARYRTAAGCGGGSAVLVRAHGNLLPWRRCVVSRGALSLRAGTGGVGGCTVFARIRAAHGNRTGVRRESVVRSARILVEQSTGRVLAGRRAGGGAVRVAGAAVEPSGERGCGGSSLLCAVDAGDTGHTVFLRLRRVLHLLIRGYGADGVEQCGIRTRQNERRGAAAGAGVVGRLASHVAAAAAWCVARASGARRSHGKMGDAAQCGAARTCCAVAGGSVLFRERHSHGGQPRGVGDAALRRAGSGAAVHLALVGASAGRGQHGASRCGAGTVRAAAVAQGDLGRASVGGAHAHGVRSVSADLRLHLLRHGAGLGCERVLRRGLRHTAVSAAARAGGASPGLSAIRCRLRLAGGRAAVGAGECGQRPFGAAVSGGAGAG